jgi:dTDP-glucose 4,6-dehydratase
VKDRLDKSTILVTGGAGFMGSSFIRYMLSKLEFIGKIINYDALTYCGNLNNLYKEATDPRYAFILGDIVDQKTLENAITTYNVDIVVHFAAETHVDRSIADGESFVRTNVLGTFHLLEVIRRHPHIRLHHVSTDEVYGSLGESGSFFEDSPYKPNSPYSASKAAADHFVRAYIHTYNIKATISHAGNNYGPCQYPEKLIPFMIERLIEEKTLPLYGDGRQVREWLYVEDHARAIEAILLDGELGQVYNVGSQEEKTNLELVRQLIDAFAAKMDKDPKEMYQKIAFVQDRPGHDFRYAMNTTKMQAHTRWKPLWSLEQGLKKTVAWYIEKRSCRQYVQK